MEISNKTLAWLVVAAIVVSIFGTTVSLWNLNNKENFAGYATSNTTGSASVDVSQSVILRFAVNATNFGAGSVNSSMAGVWSCNMMINGTTGNPAIARTGCVGFNPASGALVMENAGTSYLSVTLNVSKSASQFGIIGGSDAIGINAFRYAIANNESGSCVGTLNNGTWTAVEAVPTPQLICTNLSWSGGTNSLLVGISLNITGNATQGARSVTFTAQGTNS